MKKTVLRVALPLSGLALLGAFVWQARVVAGAAKHPAAAASAGNAAHGIRAEGRLVAYPGAEVRIGSDLAGTISRLPFSEKQAVRRGDVVAELRNDDIRAELDEARSRVREAEADVRLFAREVERARRLWEGQSGSQQAVDQRERDRDSAAARRDTATAQVRRLEAVLAKTRITSPISGVVLVRLAEPGETIAAGSPILTVADLGRTRVEAEVDEFDAGRVRRGSKAIVTAEGYSGSGWIGEVEEVPDQVTGRKLKPEDPGRPSDTRVLLVKVALKEPTPLKLGQRVELVVGGDTIPAR